jgi:hypothetical protein
MRGAALWTVGAAHTASVGRPSYAEAALAPPELADPDGPDDEEPGDDVVEGAVEGLVPEPEAAAPVVAPASLVALGSLAGVVAPLEPGRESLR